ncbi:TonB-dependent siderophore receptor [Pseudoalteromonas sp. SG44-17]|uniref:TonB-dependent siderophore receptor n=1 Tax=Pseudoalteromonas sp. SG44-17 TaxID=2760963 RepID=UPI0016045468|nr:TonB-dependent siderophore receptor [Pseudoalteromonas sp. SG44-17]MBB1408042.1 TonB-dependent siderophore receptor [Pseudoalteromonas sp. SG44-17]
MKPSLIALALSYITIAPVVVAAQTTAAGFATDESTVVKNDIETISVVGRAFSLYRPTESTFGTRTDTPLEKIPQSIQVIPQALISDQAARQVTDLYSNIAGVNGFSYSGVTFRGFRQDEILYDGVKGDPFSGFAVPQLFNIEQVAVLKGPSGAVYGSGNPGGIINYMTKKPSYDSKTTVAVELGNDDFFSAAVESTGSANDAQTQAYRVGVYKDSDKPFRENTSEDNTIIDLGYRFDFNNDTNLVLQYTHVDQDLGGARLRGVPVDKNGNFIADISWNHNEATDYQTVIADVFQASFQHQFNEVFRSDITARYFSNDANQNYHEPRGLSDTDGDGVLDWSEREFRDQQRENTGLSFTANLIADTELAAMQHVMLVGVDWYKHEFESAYRTAVQASKGGPVPGISILNPVYGLTSKDDYDLANVTPRLASTESTRIGLYAQDQVDVTDKWNVTVGLRYDRFEDTDVLNNTEFSDSDVTYRIGTSYNLNDTFFPYALYGTGFMPQSASNQNQDVGGPFKPEHSNIRELGLRTKLLDDSLAVNMATYRIIRNNILQASTELSDTGVDQMEALGEVDSRGFELEIVGDVTERLVITASYAYNDTRIVEQSEKFSAQAKGSDKFANAPQNTAGLWTRYELPQLHSSIAAGLDYVDEQVSLDGDKVQPYTVYNMAWKTEYQQWVWQLSVKNVFDKEYASSGFITRAGHFPGEPRRVYLSAKYTF